ncbi:MAG: chloride channel protein [Saprospiraceae bacterium]|nr:chloride channel protein [Saprospiraceae bacterium]
MSWIKIIQWGRSKLKEIYDRSIETNSQIRIQLFQFFPFLIASVLTGIMAFFYSRIFHYAESLSFYIYNQHKASIFISTPLAFIISWWLVHVYARFARGSGIPQVMAAIELAQPTKKNLIPLFISPRIIVFKIISSAVKVVGGGIVGREGPTIQISSSIFNQVYKWLPNWWQPISQKNILLAGASSGLAAAFNTPLGGIIFAIEELSKFHIRYYRYPLFIAVIIAGLTAQGLGGPYLYLGHPKTNFSGWMIYAGIIITGILSGYLGAWMCSFMLRFMNFVNRQKKRIQQLSIVLGCALVVAVIIYFFGTEAMGSGKSIMERTLFTDQKKVEWYLPLIRIVGLVFSFSFGGAGGVFAPSLSIGASIGAVVSDLLRLTEGNANLLILVGMTGFLTAVTRAPFTSAIIIFEMTDRHSIIFYLLFGAVISNIIASISSRKSFYDAIKESYLKEVGEAEERPTTNG